MNTLTGSCLESAGQAPGTSIGFSILPAEHFTRLVLLGRFLVLKEVASPKHRLGLLLSACCLRLQLHMSLRLADAESDVRRRWQLPASLLIWTQRTQPDWAIVVSNCFVSPAA